MFIGFASVNNDGQLCLNHLWALQRAQASYLFFQLTFFCFFCIVEQRSWAATPGRLDEGPEWALHGKSCCFLGTFSERRREMFDFSSAYCNSSRNPVLEVIDGDSVVLLRAVNTIDIIFSQFLFFGCFSYYLFSCHLIIFQIGFRQ